ncbi:MAG: hypothetical protein ACREOF_06750 [Gemmatimonadales bacterium]
MGDARDRPVRRMYALFSPDPMLLHRLRAAMPADRDVVVTDRWLAFERSAAHASCLIVGLRWLHDWFSLGASALDPPSLAPPLVLVTARDADNARAIKDIRVDEVVWLQDLERDLVRAAHRAQSRGVLERLARAIETTRALPTLLQRALAHACRADPPIMSVARLGATVGRDRRTMWRLWADTLGRTVGWRLEDVLGWLVLVRALTLKTPRASWASIAQQLGVHEHTLARLAMRLVGVNLSALADQGELAVAQRFVAAFATPLVGAGETNWAETGRSALAGAPPRAVPSNASRSPAPVV